MPKKLLIVSLVVQLLGVPICDFSSQSAVASEPFPLTEALSGVMVYSVNPARIGLSEGVRTAREISSSATRASRQPLGQDSNGLFFESEDILTLSAACPLQGSLKAKKIIVAENRDGIPTRYLWDEAIMLFDALAVTLPRHRAPALRFLAILIQKNRSTESATAAVDAILKFKKDPDILRLPGYNEASLFYYLFTDISYLQSYLQKMGLSQERIETFMKAVGRKPRPERFLSRRSRSQT